MITDAVLGRHLTQALLIATDNVADGGGPFGALVVRGDVVVATGVNCVTRDLDPTAHAEVVAIRAACRALGDFRLSGCVLVSSCEPCPLCLSAALWARVDRVVYAADRHGAAAAGFDDRAFYELFDRPRDTWDMATVHVAAPGHDAPFEAWRASAARTAY